MTVPHKQGTCKKHGDATFFWHTDKRQRSGGRWECRQCALDNTHSRGIRPISEVSECSIWLGAVAERALSGYFRDIERMPYGNKGYDFQCDRGFKIDVKASRLLHTGSSYRWKYQIRKNKVPDYFLCVGLEADKTPVPRHVWLIPGHVVNCAVGFSIPEDIDRRSKWMQYERPIKNTTECFVEAVKCEGELL